MSVLVKKFGGSSLADLQKIEFIADKIAAFHNQQQRIVIVVSAMQGDTDQLENFAHQISANPDPREMSALLATGEQKIIALLAIALIKRGCPAVSYTGLQLGIETDGLVNKAKIKQINIDNIYNNLSQGKVVIVAGFQGYDQSGNITTLGRGGSDTTAVALSIALNANQCHIYTDVDGVYTADPNLVPSATKLSNIHFSEMLELSGLGAKVMQIQAVELACHYNMPIQVSSSFKDIDNNDDTQGTLINSSKELSCSRTIKIASLSDQVKVNINNIKQPELNCIFKNFAKLQLRVDMIDAKVTDIDNEFNISWVINKRHLELCKGVLRSINLDQMAAVAYKFVGKISLVGFGLSYAPEIISSIYHDLFKSNIPVCQIVTSEIKVSILVNDKDLEAAVNVLHTAFDRKKVTASTC